MDSLENTPFSSALEAYHTTRLMAYTFSLENYISRQPSQKLILNSLLDVLIGQNAQLSPTFLDLSLLYTLYSPKYHFSPITPVAAEAIAKYVSLKLDPQDRNSFSQLIDKRLTKDEKGRAWEQAWAETLLLRRSISVQTVKLDGSDPLTRVFKCDQVIIFDTLENVEVVCYFNDLINVLKP